MTERMQALLDHIEQTVRTSGPNYPIDKITFPKITKRYLLEQEIQVDIDNDPSLKPEWLDEAVRETESTTRRDY